VPRDEEAVAEDEDDQDDPDELGGVEDAAGAGEVEGLPIIPEELLELPCHQPKNV
jgi:hypothetical protein